MPQTNERTVLNGWLHEIKDLGGVKFIYLRNSTEIIQIVVKKDAEKDILEAVKQLRNESVFTAIGVFQESDRAQGGREFIPEEIIIHSASEELPIPVAEKGSSSIALDKRLDWRSLDLRKQSNQAIFKIQSAIIEGFAKSLLSQNFIQIFTPCLMGVASESGSDVFPVIYYDKEAFLRQDPQLHRQLTIAGGLTNIFEIGPAWRAEQSHTNRHLSEHRVCAVEAGFIKDEFDVMKIEERIVHDAIKNVAEKCQKELKILGRSLSAPKLPFPVITFKEIAALMKSHGKEFSETEDLNSEAEKILWSYAKEEYNSEFYFVDKFSFKIKPFYVMKDNSLAARSFDLYFRGVELSSGGQRENKYKELMNNIKEKGIKPQEIEWFTKFFKYGVPTHGGFAIGIERFTMQLLELENIRDAVLYPRDTKRLVP